MDASEMRQLLRGYLGELDWSDGATKDDLMACLTERDDALRTMVNEYVAEGTYEDLDAVLNVIPAQAWQSTQGDTWRGPESQYVEDVESEYQTGPVGQDDSGVYREGGPRPETPGFGASAGAQGGPSGQTARGGAGSSASGGSRASGGGAGTGAGSPPRGGMPGDGAGRIEDPGTRHAGVWPASGPLPDNPDARYQPMASFGQGARGAAGYEDSGRSEAMTIPPGDEPAQARQGSDQGRRTSDGSQRGAGGNAGSRGGDASSGQGGVGAAGSNAGEVDPGVGGGGETVREPPA